MNTRWIKRARALGAAAMAFVAGAASAQVGPDVIVGDLQDVSTYTSSGAIRAYAVGTLSCNVGDTPLKWIDCTSGTDCDKHPVISQNLYRITSGRFEQIGQAWLKHGFCALQGNVCSACTPGGNCDALFPGCSDPYSSSLNGSQSGLGPKSEVNPSTGTFPYPWINNGSGSGTLFKRLQVRESEITSSTDLYFVSSIYIQPEDAAFGNDNNNQSYRRVTFGAAPGLTMALQGTTQRTKPAVYAWKDNGLGVGVADPDVFITPADIAGDGRFLVAAKARDLGAGQWRYEYAVQNLTSDRAAGSFSVPLPAGTVVTNVGFKDVDYHSGEPYSGTDWTNSVSASSVTWNCTQTFAQNANANALRWDTVYNFWFDCNRPPSGGGTTLGLFKPGAAPNPTVATIIPSPTGVFQPLNDNCANATDVSNGAISFTTTNATTDGPAEPGTWTIGNYTQIGNDIWFRYTAGSCVSGPTTVSTCGSGFDTKIAVYTGTCPTTSSAIIANDDSTTCGASSTQSNLTFQAVANTSYLIRIGGYEGATGTGTLTITPPNCGPVAPSNDTCANASWIADGVLATGSTALAVADGTTSCGTSNASRDVYFRYRPTTTGVVNINTCGSAFDTVLSIHTACGATAANQVANGCNDDEGTTGPCANSTLQSALSVSLTANVTYFIRVAGYSNSSGNFNLRVTGGGGTVPVLNDDCTNRQGISLGNTSLSTIGATTDGPTHTSCSFNAVNQITNDVWFNYPSQCTGQLTISTCDDASFNTKMAVYSGTGCLNYESRLMACSDDNCGTRTSITIPVVNGQNYTIRVGSPNGTTGTGTLVLSCVPTPSCGTSDFDGDGDAGTDGDIEAFFACLAGSCCPTCYSGGSDFDGDGDAGTDSDIEAFFRVLAGQPC